MNARLRRTIPLAIALLLISVMTARAQSYRAVVSRSAGPDRISTSVAVAQRNWSSAQTAIIATGFDFPDALAAAALSAHRSAPVLLSERHRLPEPVRAELQRLGVREVLILGGQFSISADVEAAIGSMGISTRRLAGTDRFETAALVAREVGSATREVTLAFGRNWPDAVAAGALAASDDRVPVLLTESQGIPQPTNDALAALGIQTVFIVGGTAVISPSIDEELRGRGLNVVRLAGNDRYLTSATVAENAFNRISKRPASAIFASGGNFPDALAAAGAAGRDGGVLLLVDPVDLNRSPVIGEFVRVRTSGMNRAQIIGGAIAVGSTVDWQLRANLMGEVTPTAQFPTGTWRVNGDIAPGTYRNSDSSQTCYWKRMSGFSGSFDEINANGIADYRVIVTISPSDAGFESSRCGTWSPDLSPTTPSPTAPFGEGMYLVGHEIAPGTWRNSDSSESCYWKRMRSFTGEFDDIIANGLSESIQTVTIAATDAGFESSRCGVWTKIG